MRFQYALYTSRLLFSRHSRHLRCHTHTTPIQTKHASRSPQGLCVVFTGDRPCELLPAVSVFLEHAANHAGKSLDAFDEHVFIFPLASN